MRRRVLLYLTLIALSACSGDTLVRPNDVPAGPSNVISDGNHCFISGTTCTIGNPDFFFLPPMVQNPSTSPQWDPGAFNPDLEPVVKICASRAVNVADIPSAPCDAEPDRIAIVEQGSEHYKLNWQVPTSSTVFYRLAVTVGTTTLGYADLETAATSSQLKKVGTGEVIPLVDGRTLPIKFRIERYALCEVPGVGPCATKAIDVFGAGGKVALALFANSAKENGVIFKSNAATTGTSSLTTTGKRTITVERCADFRERDLTDLPTFGPCVRLRVEPALDGPLTTPALVYSCDVAAISVSGTVSPAQARRVTMHRLVGDRLEALPHDDPACGLSTASTGSVRGMLADLAHGRLAAAGRQMVSMLAPRPLYAARYIDLGGGGLTHLTDVAEGAGQSVSVAGGPRLSIAATPRPRHEFQFLLPAKFDFIDTPTDRAAYPADQLSVAVKVTDLGDEPVMNARVRFSADEGGTVSDAIKFTGSAEGSRGVAVVTWTVTPPSPNTLTATGKGIGGENSHGPRNRTTTKVDPFQPCDHAWEVAGSPLTCTETHTPTGLGIGTMQVTAITVGKIGGNVLNAQTGGPLAGATVAWAPAADGTTPSVTTGDGTFLIENLTPGTRAVHTKYGLTIKAPKFFDGAKADVEVEPKTTTDVGDVCLAPVPGHLDGAVTSSIDNVALDGATVTTIVSVAAVPRCGIEASSHTVTATTAGGGKFSLELPPGSYSVLVTDAPEYYDAARVSADVRSAETTTLSPVALKWKFGRVAGTVVDATDATKPIAGATVTATLQTGEGAGASSASDETFTATTDDRGAFELRKLTAGSYSLAVTPPTTEYLEGSGTAVVQEAEVTRLSPIALTPNFGAISGTVRSGKLAIAKATVTASLNAKESVTDVAKTITDENGAFLLDKLPVGPYTVAVEADGYLIEKVGAKVGGGFTTKLEITLVPEVTGITVTVVDDKTVAPISGAKVYLEKSGYEAKRSDGSGTVNFPSLKYATYEVTVSADGYETSTTKVDFSSGLATAVVIRLVRAVAVVVTP